ncbi:hypothetical protein [Ligilactobacillus ceti]|nr:hypothetical protein [Ligilactobacillus ceti]
MTLISFLIAWWSVKLFGVNIGPIINLIMSYVGVFYSAILILLLMSRISQKRTSRFLENADLSYQPDEQTITFKKYTYPVAIVTQLAFYDGYVTFILKNNKQLHFKLATDLTLADLESFFPQAEVIKPAASQELLTPPQKKKKYQRRLHGLMLLNALTVSVLFIILSVPKGLSLRWYWLSIVILILEIGWFYYFYLLIHHFDKKYAFIKHNTVQPSATWRTLQYYVQILLFFFVTIMFILLAVYLFLFASESKEKPLPKQPNYIQIQTDSYDPVIYVYKKVGWLYKQPAINQFELPKVTQKPKIKAPKTPVQPQESEPKQESLSVQIEKGMHQIFAQEFASHSGFQYRQDYNAQGQPIGIVFENQHHINYLLFDKKSSNQKCLLYIYYQSQKNSDGSYSPSEAEFLNSYAYNINTQKVVASGQKDWSDQPTQAFLNMTE